MKRIGLIILFIAVALSRVVAQSQTVTLEASSLREAREPRVFGDVMLLSYTFPAPAAEGLAPVPHDPGGRGRRGQRGPCAADRGHDGDGVESSALRAGRGGGGKGDRRPAIMDPADSPQGVRAGPAV